MSRRAFRRTVVSRREFLHASVRGGLVLAFSLSGPLGRTAVASAGAFAPNAYLRVGDDGAVTLWCTRSEMGQGVRTTLPMILADELEVEWHRVTVAQASMTPAFAGTRLRTSGSGSSAGTWTPLRTAAATAREMLRAAAAEWRAAIDDCRCERGAVVHAPSGRRLEYGSLVARAASVPVPKAPPLKPAAAFTLVGTRVNRVDGPAIVTGRATYGLDVRLPGQRFAAVARAPRLGSRAVRWDPAAARAVAGVVDVVPVTSGIATGVAVVATSTHAALTGREALQVTTTWHGFFQPAAAHRVEAGLEPMAVSSRGPTPSPAPTCRCTARRRAIRSGSPKARARGALSTRPTTSAICASRRCPSTARCRRARGARWSIPAASLRVNA